MTRDSLSLSVGLVLLAVIFRLIWNRLDVLPLFYRFWRRELPKTTITLQPSTPARPMSLRDAKGLQPSNVVPFVRTFGTSQEEWDRIERRRLSAVAQTKGAAS